MSPLSLWIGTFGGGVGVAAGGAAGRDVEGDDDEFHRVVPPVADEVGIGGAGGVVFEIGAAGGDVFAGARLPVQAQADSAITGDGEQLTLRRSHSTPSGCGSVFC